MVAILNNRFLFYNDLNDKIHFLSKQNGPQAINGRLTLMGCFSLSVIQNDASFLDTIYEAYVSRLATDSSSKPFWSTCTRTCSCHALNPYWHPISGLPCYSECSIREVEHLRTRFTTGKPVLLQMVWSSYSKLNDLNIISALNLPLVHEAIWSILEFSERVLWILRLSFRQQGKKCVVC